MMKASPTANSEDSAFKDLSNALLEILDRQVDTKSAKNKPGDGGVAAARLHSKAAEITETLKIYVRDALDGIKQSDYGKLKEREMQLLAENAQEKQTAKDLSHQINALKSALERIQKMHAEEMTTRQEEYLKHFKTEIANLSAEHEAEIRRLKASFSQAGTVNSHIGNHVDALKSQFGQSEEFHTAQANRLQSEIDGFKAEGKYKEAEARVAYLTYHQNEITKIKGIIGLAGEKGSLMEQAVNALQARYAAELEASRAAHAQSFAQDKIAMQKDCHQRVDKAQKDLASAQSLLAAREEELRVAKKAAAEAQALKADHSAAVSQLKEEHRSEMYLLQARQMKLQKELSQRMDAMSLNSQDSMSRLPGTMRRFGGTMSRLANPEGRETASPKMRYDSMQLRQGNERHQTMSFRFPATLSAAELQNSQDDLEAQLRDLDRHYEAMQANRGRLDEYDG